MSTICSFAAVVAIAIALVVPAAPVAAQTASSGIRHDVLTTNTQDPISLQVAADGRIIWIEREGSVNVLSPDGRQVEAGRIPVSANDCNPVFGASTPAGPVTAGQPAGAPDGCLVLDVPVDSSPETDPNKAVPPPAFVHTASTFNSPTGLLEGGLMGLLLAPDFATSGRIYLYRSVPGTYDQTTLTGLWRLSTFVLRPDNTLDYGSEKVLFELRAEWLNGSHYGGNLEWLPDGTILLSTGDDVRYQSSSGYGPRDHRFDRTQGEANNGELTSANPASRMGKILRLMPDGSVPDGSQPGIAPNPFIGKVGHNPYICLPLSRAFGGPGGYNPFAKPDACPAGGHDIPFDPYVYALGIKQPWRMAVFPDGGAYFGDVGPDANSTTATHGPRGYEEINFLPPGGGTDYGWPRCQGPNIPYVNFDWSTNTGHGLLDCSTMTPATIYYTNAASTQWPSVGTGGKTSQPVAVYPAATTGAMRLPREFDNTMFVFEWTRRWIKAIPYDPATDALELDDTKWIPVRTNAGSNSWGNGPLDAVVGPDGALYVLEYGSAYYNNSNSRIGRITCATCEPSSASENYGLPLPSAAEGASVPATTGGLARGAAVSVGGVLLLLGQLGRSRRRRVAV
jgi:aldose sugar dehydrogenase